MDPPHKPVAFILDFDGTITTKDTIATLASFGLAYQKGKGRDLTHAWNEVLQRYGEDHLKHAEDYRPPKEERSTLADEVSYYRSLRNVELRSFERVGKSSIFEGIGQAEWQAFGHEALARGEVKARGGFNTFVEHVNKSCAVWGVVSANFSSHFIRGVLAASAGPESIAVEILANLPDHAGLLHGPEHGHPMATSDAKLASMQEMLEAWKRNPKVKTNSSRLVYVGDSGTDIECLTAKDVVGVAMSENGAGSLMETMKRIDIDVLHISSYEGYRAGSLYWARDFSEITNSPLFTSYLAKRDVA